MEWNDEGLLGVSPKFNLMGLAREPQDVDFYVDPRPLTAEEKDMISEYIKNDKGKRHKPSYDGAQQKLKASKRATTAKTKHKSKQ